jgi:hypothetical protein
MIWSAVGPAPQINGNVAFSGRVTAIAKSIDFDGAGTPAMFLATDGGGVWRSTQFVGNVPVWQPLTDIVPTTVGNRTLLSSIQSITVSPNNSRLLYAGSGAGILRSLDGGDNWSLIPNSPGSARKIVVDARPNGTAVWAGGDFGLGVSADGTLWGPAMIGGFGFTSFSVDDLEWTVSGDGKTFTIYAAVHDTAKGNDGSRNGIYATITEGGVWDETAINPIDHDSGQPVTPKSFGTITLGADHIPGSPVPPVAAFSKASADWQHAILLNIFKLTLGAWEPIGTGLPNGLDTQGGANQPITVSSGDAVYFAVSGQFGPAKPAAVFQSLDGGGHWSDITTAGGIRPHADHHGLLFTNGALYDGNDGGIWRFTPLPNNQPGPGTWEHLNTPGLQTIEVQGVAIHPTDPATVLAGSQDNGTALRIQGVWKNVQGSDRGRVRFATGSKSAYSVTYGWFDRSDDSGANWGAVTLPGGQFAAGSMQNFEVDPYGTGRILIAGLHGTWLSKDKGGSWKQIAPALTGEPNSIAAMAFSTATVKLYLAFGNGQVFRTTNEGTNGTAGDWSDISGGTAWGGMIVALATDPASSDAVYLITTGSTVWRTVDAGANWQNLTSDLPGIGLNALVLAARGGDPYVLVGTSSGVYGCAAPAVPRWRRLGSGIPYVKVVDLSYQAASDVLAAGTYGRGVFLATVGSISPPKIHITWPVEDASTCRVDPAEGQTLKVSAGLQGVNNLTGYQFAWTITGAQLAAGETGNKPSVNVILPSPPAPVTLAVSVQDDDGFVGTVTRVLTPITLSEVAIELFVCKLKQLYMKFPQLPWWVHPGDPEELPSVQPLTERELEHVLSISEQMVVTARSAISLMKLVRRPSTVGRLPEGIPMDQPAEAGPANTTRRQ